jgi:hypothetical protein
MKSGGGFLTKYATCWAVLLRRLAEVGEEALQILTNLSKKVSCGDGLGREVDTFPALVVLLNRYGSFGRTVF